LACTNLAVVQLDDGAGGWTTVLSKAVTPSPTDVELADLDEDGAKDLIFNEANPINQTSPILHVMRGHPDGAFDTEPTVSTDWDGGYGTERAFQRIHAFDFDEDGHLDLAGPDQRTHQFLVLRGNGDRTFRRPESFLGGWGKVFMDLGDFNGDGHVDL